MNHAAISYDDIVRLKHLRNVGEFVTGMAVVTNGAKLIHPSG